MPTFRKVGPDGRFSNQVKWHETHLSTQQNQACSYARVPCAHGHESRAPGAQAAARKRPSTVNAVTLATTTKNNLGLVNSPGFQFQRISRLGGAAEFSYIFEDASRSRDRFFTVLFRDNEQRAARLGLAISRKNCRRAVARNRIKRIIRESFRQNQAILFGLDLVVINQPAAASADNGAMNDSLARHWQRCSKQTRKQYPQES